MEIEFNGLMSSISLPLVCVYVVAFENIANDYLVYN